MKKILYLFTLILTFSIPAWAQPTITNILYSTIGDKVVSKVCDTAGLVLPTGGSDKTWDYSNLTVKSTTTQEAVAVTGVPNIDKFPTANIAVKSDTAYSVYNISSNKMERLGTTGSGIIELLTNTEIDFTTPFTMGSNQSDDYEGTITSGGNTINRSGSLSSDGIGYGTVISPKGTFTNVLLVNQKNTIVDQITIQGFTSKTTTTMDNYIFLKEGEHEPVLSISSINVKTEVAGNVISNNTYKHVEYFDLNPIKLPPNPPIMVSPADGEFNLSIPVTLRWQELKSSIKPHGEINASDISYKVQVSANANFMPLTYSTETTDTFAVVTQLDNATKYYWRVQSVSGDVSSDWTTASSFSTEAAAIGKPSLSSPTQGAFKIPIVPTFTWTQVSGADNYTIQIASANDFASPLYNETVTQPSFTIPAHLEYSSQYFWRVKANKGDASGEWSDTWSFTTQNPPQDPPAPSEPPNNETGINPDATILKWEDKGPDAKYHLQVATDENFDDLEFDVPNNLLSQPEYTLPQLMSNTGYYWRVTSTVGSITSDWSTVWTFTTGTSGVNDWNLNPLNMNIKLIPMPAQSQLSLTFTPPTDGNVNFNVMDINGKVLMSVNGGYVPSGTGVHNFDISTLPAGSYFISIEGDSFKAVTKFIKK